MLEQLRGHIPKLANAVVQARATGTAELRLGDHGRGRHRPQDGPQRAAQGHDHPPPARQEGREAARGLRQAQRERGRLKLTDLTQEQLAPGDRLRARQPQARHRDRAGAEPAGERAVPRLRRPHRARRSRSGCATPTRRRPSACATTRGATSAASRCSRPPRASSAQRILVMSGAVLEIPAPQDPTGPIVPDAPTQPAVPDPGPAVPDMPDGPSAPEPDDPLPAGPRRAVGPAADEAEALTTQYAVAARRRHRLHVRRHVPDRPAVRRHRRLRGRRGDVARARARLLGVAHLPRPRGGRGARDPGVRHRRGSIRSTTRR